MHREILPRCLGPSFVILLLLAACGTNTYGPPPNGQPQNWGQQHYLDVQKYRQLNENRMR